jgi:hypothetical protein
MLLFNDKCKVERKRLVGVKTAKIAVVSAFILIVLLMVFQTFWSSSFFYYALFPITVFALLIGTIGSTDSNRMFLIFSVVLLHLIVLSTLFPAFGIFIDERTAALIQLEAAGKWNTSWTMLNAYYSPFPMDLGLFFVFQAATGLSSVNLFGIWIVSLLFVVAYDLVLFSLCKKISGSWKVGVFGILLFAFLPPAAINPSPQCIASLFILVFLLGLVRALKSGPSISSIVLINLSYLVAILVHGTAAVGLVAVFVLFVSAYLGPKLGVNVATMSRHRSFLSVVLVSVGVITWARLKLLGGLISITTPLSGLANAVLGRGQGSSIIAKYVPLYNQFVSPIIAYAWVVPISLGAAFVLYHVLGHAKRKSLGTVFVSSLVIAGAVLALGGFLGARLVASANLQRYLGYSGLVLFIPAAAIVVAKISRSSSRKILSVVLISLVLFSAIGIFDPAFSPKLYSNINTVNPASQTDIIEVKTLYSIFPSGISGFATYEISTGFSYIETMPQFSGKVINFGGSLKTARIMVESLMENGTSPGVTYVWTPQILAAAANVSVNVVYDSGRHVAVQGAGG